MKYHLTKEQQSEIASLIGQNKVRLTAYIRSQFRDISDLDIEDCFQDLFVRTYEKFSSFNRSPDKTGSIVLEILYDKTFLENKSIITQTNIY